MQIGDVIVLERAFTEAEIRSFGHLSGDEGTHHVTPDEQGRLMVHGLLTATLPTKIGGQLNFIARELRFQFLRPVFAGESIHCEVKIVDIEQTEQHTRLAVEWVCRNEQGKDVMTGQARGVVRK